jgi:hypothetical protein
VAGEDVGDHQILDREGGFDATRGECGHDRLGHAEIGEGLR